MNNKATQLCIPDGSTVLICEHLDPDSDRRPDGARIYGIQESVFIRPDGTSGKSGWVMICNVCFRSCMGRHPTEFIKRDVEWIGDEPIEVTQRLN